VDHRDGGRWRVHERQRGVTQFVDEDGVGVETAEPTPESGSEAVRERAARRRLGQGDADHRVAAVAQAVRDPAVVEEPPGALVEGTVDDERDAHYGS
jgi:hypothetical protein